MSRRQGERGRRPRPRARIKTNGHHNTDDIVVPMRLACASSCCTAPNVATCPTARPLRLATATRNTQDNIYRYVLQPVLERANELLVKAGRPPIQRLTPHILRRTFASILAECGVAPRRAMHLLGHTDPKPTMAVYQQVLDMGGQAVQELEDILGCSLADAREIYSGRQPLGALETNVSALNLQTATKKPSDARPSGSSGGLRRRRLAGHS